MKTYSRVTERMYANKGLKTIAERKWQREKLQEKANKLAEKWGARLQVSK